MSTWKKLAIGAAAIGLLGTGVYAVTLLTKPATPTPAVAPSQEETAQGNTSENKAEELLNQTLPAFSVQTPEGSPVESDSFTEKPLFIMQWASWCPYCQEQLPRVQAVFERYGDRVDFVMVNATGAKGETVDSAADYITSKNFTFPWYTDEGLKTADTLGVTGLPTIFVVNKDKTVTSVFTSVQTEDTLVEAIEAVLN